MKSQNRRDMKYGIESWMTLMTLCHYDVTLRHYVQLYPLDKWCTMSPIITGQCATAVMGVLSNHTCIHQVIVQSLSAIAHDMNQH